MIIEKTKALIARITPLRWIVLKLLRMLRNDLVIKNPYSRKPFKINSYFHKGYWYFGVNREQATVESTKKLVFEGDLVIEVGGHIGFLSHLYSGLVGPNGVVHVFEPGANNLPYTRHNLAGLSNGFLHEKGCGNEPGHFELFEDSITGQNNSLLPDYVSDEILVKAHFVKNKRAITTVEVIRLGDFISEINKVPDHVKIDVEGFEFEVLRGLGKYLGKITSLMVEVTEKHEEVLQLMKRSGYKPFNASLCPVSETEVKGWTNNMFFVLKSDC